MKENFYKPVENVFSQNPLKSTEEFDGRIYAVERSERLKPVSDETKKELKNKEWSDTIIENIGSEEEAQIYQEAGIEPDVINEKDVLIKTDIDIDQKDVFGNTNLERMEKGQAPLDKNSRPIELHHIGQKNDSPLAELNQSEHRGKGNDSVLHNKTKESEINREEFATERAEHWKARAEQIKSELAKNEGV